VAAGIAGYAAVNAAALLAAIEFGVQPMLFHDASGTPLYAPYGLHIAIPAMMIGHLTFAGMAEAVIAAGVVAYLQVADPILLRGTSGLTTAPPADVQGPRRPANSLRRLWLAVAGLMLLTPLGILAAGTAWGEWSPSQLAAGGVGSPASMAPSGLQRLATLWTAPFPGYAPEFVRSRSFGYLLSAMFGVGLLICLSFLTQVMIARSRRRGSPA
jgi:cobalt/nickel transport system permease protein